MEDVVLEGDPFLREICSCQESKIKVVHHLPDCDTFNRPLLEEARKMHPSIWKGDEVCYPCSL